jgi:aspartate/methionine/tyrosine aminotransferase
LNLFVLGEVGEAGLLPSQVPSAVSSQSTIPAVADCSVYLRGIAVKVAPFRIEKYYERYEFTTGYMLSSSDCESRTIRELLSFEPDASDRLLELRCGYTESPGSLELREAIAAIYDTIHADEVVATSCAEEAIFLLYHVLLGPGDQAVVETPCYESALQLARSTGAEVREWRRSYEGRWKHDLGSLGRLVQPGTRVVHVNQPHNPTGTLMDRATYDAVVELAQDRGVTLFCDEVYRELEHDPNDRLPAACDRDERAVSLGSVSKSYGLPGLRTGWIATHDDKLRRAVIDLKHYTTICASAPSEQLSALALRHRGKLLARNSAIVRRNLGLLDGFFSRHAAAFEWVRPVASPIGFPRVHGLGDVDRLCERLAEAGVLLLPGSVFDEPDHVRFGFGRANLPEALAVLEEALPAC